MLFRCNVCGRNAKVKKSALRGETPNCSCGSSVRLRSLAHHPTNGLLGQSMAIPEIPLRPNITAPDEAWFDIVKEQTRLLTVTVRGGMTMSQLAERASELRGDPMLDYLMPPEVQSWLHHPASIEEAREILERHLEVSCLWIRQQGGRYDFKELLCRNKTCLDRSRNVFASIRGIVEKHRLPVRGDRFIFHFKGDACELRPNFPLLANSRNIDNDRVILWPLLIRRNYLFSFTRYSPYLHDEITKYRHKPDSIAWENKLPIFFFRGMNSGNPFCSVQYPWNQFRCSRQRLLDEALGLPEGLRRYIDIGFNELYPRVATLKKNVGNKLFLEGRFGKYLVAGRTVDHVQEDIARLLPYIKPSLRITELFRYRFLLCPEGFDCSSALSWVLASNSLAIVPPFHYENVIINGRQLKPYTHFLPIREDYADLAEVMRWALAHEDECRQMVHEANTYMRPFVDDGSMAAVQKTILEHLLA